MRSVFSLKVCRVQTQAPSAFQKETAGEENKGEELKIINLMVINRFADGGKFFAN